MFSSHTSSTFFSMPVPDGFRSTDTKEGLTLSHFLNLTEIPLYSNIHEDPFCYASALKNVHPIENIESLLATLKTDSTAESIPMRFVLTTDMKLILGPDGHPKDVQGHAFGAPAAHWAMTNGNAHALSGGIFMINMETKCVESISLNCGSFKPEFDSLQFVIIALAKAYRANQIGLANTMNLHNTENKENYTISREDFLNLTDTLENRYRTTLLSNENLKKISETFTKGYHEQDGELHVVMSSKKRKIINEPKPTPPTPCVRRNRTRKFTGFLDIPINIPTTPEKKFASTYNEENAELKHETPEKQTFGSPIRITSRAIPAIPPTPSTPDSVINSVLKM